MSSSRQHNSGPDSDGPDVPEPSHAERAKTLVYLQSSGSLSTLSRKQPGWPFGSVMPYGLDDEGQPVFLISTMAMHTQNLLGDPRASLLVTPPESRSDPLGAARVTLMGSVTRVPKEEAVEVRERYLARHANASYWVDFQDFGFFRMALADIYFVGGFGSMGWVMPDDYAGAAVDPLADEASNLIREFNTEQADDVAATCPCVRQCGGAAGDGDGIGSVGFSPSAHHARPNAGWAGGLSQSRAQRVGGQGRPCRLGRSGERGTPDPAFAVVGACTSSCEHPARLFFSTHQFITR